MPGRSSITSALQLKNFSNYKLPPKSPLRKESVYTGRYGINKLKLE
jgi:hypothetical protein